MTRSRTSAAIVAICIAGGALLFGAWLGEGHREVPRLPGLGEPVDISGPRPPRIPDDSLAAMIERRPAVGMTADQVIASPWGRPHATNRTVTAGHTREQWAYDQGYVYLDDGVVTAVQIVRP